MKWLSRITAVATEVEEVTKEVYRRTFEDMAKRYIELNKKMEESEALIEQAIEEINARLEIAKLTEVTEKEENILKAMLYKLEEHKKSIDGWELKLAQAKKKSLKSKDFIEEITETFTEINPAYKQMIEFIASKHTEYPELDDIDTYKITLKKEKKAGLKINAAFVEKFKAALGKFINWLKDKWDSIIGKIDKKYADIEDAMKELENAPMLVVKEASIEKEAKSITIEEYKAGIVDAVERAFPGKTFSIGVSSILTDQNFHTPLEALVEAGICAKPTSKYDFMAIIDADKKEADDLTTVIADHDNKIGYIGMGGDKVVLEETASLKKEARDWKYKVYIPVNADKYEDPTDEGALELAKIAVNEITRILSTVPAEKDDLKDQLESVKMEFEDVVAVEDFDAALETLYDMGDSESIWIETYEKKGSLSKEAEEKTFEIPTGNAQLVYSIDGIVGEEFEVDRGGTMLPIGKYKVVTKPKVDVEHSGPWGTYSTILVERIAGNRVTLKKKAGAVCKECGKDMMDPTAKSCTYPKIKIDGEIYNRDTEYFDVNERCHDCNIVNKKGNIHHFGCDIERCPKCNGQIISCECKKEFLIGPDGQESKASMKKEATSYTDFLTNRGTEIKQAIKQLNEIHKIYDSLSEEILDKAHDKVAGIYDKNVPDYIEDWVADGDADVDSIASLALSNQDNYGTEKQMILYAIEDFYNVIMRGRKESSLRKKADSYNPYMYTSPTGPATSDAKTNHKKYMVKFKEADGSWKFSTMEDDLEAAKSQAQEIYNNEKKKSKVIDTTTSNVIFVIGAENSETLKRYASLDADIDAMEKNEHKKHVEGFKKAASLQANIEKEVYQCDNCHIRLGRFIKQLPDSCPRCGKQVKFDNVIR